MYECCFFKQKTAYEVRIMYWSSDVCSADLRCLVVRVEREEFGGQLIAREDVDIFEPPVEPHLEQRDRDLARIGRRPAIQRDHLIKSPVRASVSERRRHPVRPSAGQGGARRRVSPTAWGTPPAS